jgi:hypothetical protein
MGEIVAVRAFAASNNRSFIANHNVAGALME